MERDTKQRDTDFSELLGQWHRPGHDVQAGRGLCSSAIMRSPGRQKKMTDARATHPFAQPEDMNFKFHHGDFCLGISSTSFRIQLDRGRAAKNQAVFFLAPSLGHFMRRDRREVLEM